MNLFTGITGFQWDEGNFTKNPLKHDVSNPESESIFFNHPLIVADDQKHSAVEKRWYALGKTNEGRKLFVVFTVRKDKIRIISSRDMNRKEQSIYENAEKNGSPIQQ
jgi:uncharacterized DUF497 family protein